MEDKQELLRGLVDILLAYTYDYRTTDGEATVSFLLLR